MNIDYRNKYLKYKKKYLSLKDLKGNGENDKLVVKANVSGALDKFFVKEGDKIEAGQKLFTIFSMKIEIIFTAESSGILEKILVNEGDNVSLDQDIMIIKKQKVKKHRDKNFAIVSDYNTQKTITDKIIKKSKSYKINEISDGSENGKIIITSCVYPTSENELVNLNIFQLPYHKFSSRRLIEILNAVDFLISIINYDNLSQEDFIIYRQIMEHNKLNEKNISLCFFANLKSKNESNLNKMIDGNDIFETSNFKMQLPIYKDNDLIGYVDLLNMKANYDSKIDSIPDNLIDLSEKLNEKLIENIVENDDVVMQKYLDGIEFNIQDLEIVLKKNAKSNLFNLSHLGSISKNIGIDELINNVIKYYPDGLSIGKIFTNSWSPKVWFNPIVNDMFGNNQVYKNPDPEVDVFENLTKSTLLVYKLIHVKSKTNYDIKSELDKIVNYFGIKYAIVDEILTEDEKEKYKNVFKIYTEGYLQINSILNKLLDIVDDGSIIISKSYVREIVRYVGPVKYYMKPIVKIMILNDKEGINYGIIFEYLVTSGVKILDNVIGGNSKREIFNFVIPFNNLKETFFEDLKSLNNNILYDIEFIEFTKNFDEKKYRTVIDNKNI